jgi:site-specific DNA-methyltransferase (adenine-specific)
MAEKAAFALRERNPDVLTSIANLSNDEVFTPPAFANQMLDTVGEAWAASHKGESIWADKTVTFLDPFTKSGVFLREIVRRLTEGLEREIPDVQERVNHILTKQVFGVAITELTSLLARRSIYCSKKANGKHSIATAFSTPEGNIWFERTEHTWVGGKERVLTVDGDGNEIEITVDGACKFCGAKQKEYARGLDSESHAYSLIHTDDLKQWVENTFGEDMQFDVIIGNPPYQLDDGGFSQSAAPIYNLFVKQAQALEPRFLSMVIPARWFAGGKGLESFRQNMLHDDRIRAIHDYPDSSRVFPGVQIKGGVCYFVWHRDSTGECEIFSHLSESRTSSALRPLLEPGMEVFIRYNEAVAIVKKVSKIAPIRSNGQQAVSQESFSALVSSRKPFGIDTTFSGKEEQTKDSLLLYRNGGTGYIRRQEVSTGSSLIDSWKIFVSYAYGAGEDFPHSIIGKPFVGAPGTVSSETYLAIGPFNSEPEAQNAMSYMRTQFFRFLVMLKKPTQHGTKTVYELVPMEDFSHPWTDSQLYLKYKLTKQEIEFIESMIRPMELASE